MEIRTWQTTDSTIATIPYALDEGEDPLHGRALADDAVKVVVGLDLVL
jgi:hypothetical protein